MWLHLLLRREKRLREWKQDKVGLQCRHMFAAAVPVMLCAVCAAAPAHSIALEHPLTWLFGIYP
jgi:hypothetical protein